MSEVMESETLCTCGTRFRFGVEKAGKMTVRCPMCNKALFVEVRAFAPIPKPEKECGDAEG